MIMNKYGFTLIEMLMVVGIAGVLLAIAVNLRVPSAQLMTNDLQALIFQARLQSVKHNRPVAVTYNATTKTFSMRYNTGSGATLWNTCNSTTVLQSLPVSNYRNISLSGDLFYSLVWLPNGLLSTCFGPALTPISYIISDGHNTRTLSVSLAGKVAVQ
jgi:prepilin-type N-terminal cleavage/methylation domain-containing protein